MPGTALLVESDLQLANVLPVYMLETHKTDNGLTSQCKEAQDGLNQAACSGCMFDGTWSKLKRREIADSMTFVDTRLPRNTRVWLRDGYLPSNHLGFFHSLILMAQH